MSPSKSAIAIIMILLSALALATMDAGTKYVGGVVTITVILWARYTIQACLMALWIARTRGQSGFRTAHPGFQLLRGALLLIISALAIVSLRYIPLAEFTAIAMLSPVLITVISSRLSGRVFGSQRWSLLLCGFLGTLIMLRPGSGIFGVAALLPILTTSLYAVYCVITSRIAAVENPYTSQFYTGIIGFLAMLPFVALQDASTFGGFSTLSSTNLAILLAISLSGTGGHLLIVMAFSRANAADLMPFVYIQIGFAAMMSWLIFHHVPDVWAWAGMGVIAASGIGTAWLNIRDARFTPVAAAVLE